MKSTHFETTTNKIFSSFSSKSMLKASFRSSRIKVRRHFCAILASVSLATDMARDTADERNIKMLFLFFYAHGSCYDRDDSEP